MKSSIKNLLLSGLLLLFAFPAAAQESWVGSYQFDEDGGKTTGGTPIFVTHEMEINETDDGLVAMIRSNGYQTSRDLVGKARPEGAKLLIYFDYYGEENGLEPYSEGDLLFTLERKKNEILTFWGKFLPVVPKNEKSGKVYFKKVEVIEKSEQ